MQTFQFVPSEATIEAFADYHELDLNRFARSKLQQAILANHATNDNIIKFKTQSWFTTLNGNRFQFDPKSSSILPGGGIRIPLVKHLNGQYELKGILLTEDQLNKLDQYKLGVTNNSELNDPQAATEYGLPKFYGGVMTFNLGLNVMLNKVQGSEAKRVQQCQAKYHGGWSDKWDLPRCTKNAADLLRRYDIFGLQEVNPINAQALFNEINMNQDYKFITHDTNVIGYNIKIFGDHELNSLTETPKFQSLAIPIGRKDKRLVQVAFFETLGMLVINVHAPHDIDLRSEISTALEVIPTKLNLTPKESRLQL